MLLELHLINQWIIEVTNEIANENTIKAMRPSKCSAGISTHFVERPAKEKNLTPNPGTTKVTK